MRAMAKVHHERELARQKAAELRALENDLNVLTQERDRLGRLADKNQIYLDYLLNVVRHCKQVMAIERERVSEWPQVSRGRAGTP